jgi:methylmalonyl-CoA/ethylmalonyl-CoA epimerase
MTEKPRLRVDHIGIAVENLEEAREHFSKLLGASPSPVEEVPSEGVRVSFFDLGGCRLELLEAMTPESPIKKFLDQGRTGVHHVALALDGGDLGTLHADLASRGMPVLGPGPRAGSEGSQIFFVHPKATSGVLLEFSQKGGTK